MRAILAVLDLRLSTWKITLLALPLKGEFVSQVLSVTCVYDKLQPALSLGIVLLEFHQYGQRFARLYRPQRDARDFALNQTRSAFARAADE